MPYMLTWVDPEVVLVYKGVTVYYAYGDDLLPEKHISPMKCKYTLDKTGGERFDIRDLPVPPDIEWPLYNGEITDEDAAIKILRYAIDLGILTPNGVNHERLEEVSNS